MQKEITYAFIDSQNLNLGTSKNIYKHKRIIYKGWKVDMQKFYIYLKDRYRIKKAFLFIGYIPEYQKMYKAFESYGYTLIFKRTVKDKNGKAKGNIDAELVLLSMIEINNYDKAIIVSGDGDFACLYKYLIEKKKLKKILVPNKLSESSLLDEFKGYKRLLQFDRQKFEMKNGRRNTVPRK